MHTYQKLPTDLVDALINGHGLLSTAAMRACGAGHDRARRLVDRGALMRLARGMYTSRTLVESLRPWTQFALKSAAFTATSPDDAVAAGWSAVALRDLPHLGAPPALPSVIRRSSPPRGSDRSPYGHTRFAGLGTNWASAVHGTMTMNPAVVVVDIARQTSRLQTLIVADAVARLDGGSLCIAEALDALRHWPRIARAQWTVANADPDCDSPLETIGRYIVTRAGLPRPASNVWVGLSRPTYRIDHYFADQRFGLEGDGLYKYSLPAAGVTSSAALVAAAIESEKDREFDMRSWGISLGRYTWRRALTSAETIVAQCSSALATPPLPAHPGLRVWSATDGYRKLGLPIPQRQLTDGPGWHEQVGAALRSCFGPDPVFAG